MEKRTILRNIGRVALVSFSTAIVIYLANLGVTLLLGNVMGIPGVGSWSRRRPQMLAAITQSLPAAADR